ncbi:MAG TPA: FAD-dependent thymidylate synthase [Terracidiphilus sp.]|nr:FAD-dependent thymidylate synthase [Terracidiphilus sp.]
MSSESFDTSAARNQTEVFAVHGADPEVLAYAMAKYSRSALSMRESLTEISAQRAEQFLNTFYFQYGHRSIADLAHIAFAVERLSLLAAIVLVDEQRWDGQERSTRYQNFLKSGWYLPDFDTDAASTQLFTQTIENLFVVYQRTTAAVLEALRRRVPCPDDMKPESYERTLKARAFDVARYLLPLATNTSLGQIVNARTLETQVSRLLSSPFAEVRDLGQKLRDAATGPAFNINARAGQAFVDKLSALEKSPPLEDADSSVKGMGFTPPANQPEDAATSAPQPNVPASLAEEAASLLTREVHTAPTLVKYAEPNTYLLKTHSELAQAAAELLAQIPIAEAPLVDLVERAESLEVELAATLLYSACHHPYRQLRDLVAELSEAQVSEIIHIGLRHRGRHDEALRTFHAGAALRFDILMDIGGFRDMHRHRRVTQIRQDFTALHGYETPTNGDLGPDVDLLAEAGALDGYHDAVLQAHSAGARIAASGASDAPHSALYLLPLATRVRCLFKMDFAEAQYISELRSAPAGHFSYRRVAWEMYLALERQHPTLAKHIRVTDFTQPIDLLQR